MERLTLASLQQKPLDFPFPGGVAQLRVIEEAGHPALAIRLPYRGVYGMGERFDALNQKGQRVINKVEEHFCRQGDKTYCPAPFFFTDSGFGLCINTRRVSAFDFDEEITARFVLNAHLSLDADKIETVDFPVNAEIALFSGSPAAIIADYMTLSGPARLPPDWVFGPWISANRWNSQKQVEQQLDLLIKHDFPASVLVIEAWSDEATFYMFNGADYTPVSGSTAQRYEDFDFSASKWPDPRGMIEKLHSAGLRLLLWQIPVYKRPDKDEPACIQRDRDRAYAIEHKLCVMDNEGKPYAIPESHWFAGSVLPDFTNAETRRVWFNKRRYLLDLGVDGFKTDGGEFIYREDISFADGSGGADMINAYAQSYVRAYTDFVGEERTLFSRAGYVGQHTTPILWAGDQQSTFEELRAQLRAGLSAALSGVIFWGFDIGGFAGPLPDAELYLRATELACFSPIMQWHSEPDGGQFAGEETLANNERSPWNIAATLPVAEQEAYLDRIRAYHKLRMKLLPYLFAEACYCVEHSCLFMRPLVYGWSSEEEALAMDDEFMLGRDLLVAPVLYAGLDTRRLWLPPGSWRGFFDRKAYSGGQWLETAAATIPVFVGI